MLNFDKRTQMIGGTILLLLLLIGTLLALTVGLMEQPSPLSSDENKIRQQRSIKMVESEYRRYHTAAVTSETNICSTIGKTILFAEEGTAVDAAIATTLCACVINAHSCGIGGGHFMTIYSRRAGELEKTVATVTARERAPLTANQDMFVNNTDAALVGGLAVGVPGEIMGFYEAHRLFGRMNWADLFTETIRLCDEGFIVEPNLASAILQYNSSIRQDPNLSELFVKEDGTLIKTGDLLINKKLGKTMQLIAEDPMSFYKGQLAIDIVSDLRDYGSIITLEDMAMYTAVIKQPIAVELSNGQYTVFNPPPPSSGVVFSFIMNVLDGYNLTSRDVADTESKILSYHRIIEAFKFAYAKRSELGDEAFVDIRELVANLTSRSYCDGIRNRIDDSQTHDVEYYEPTFDIIPDYGTGHVNVLGPDGSAVAITSTVNYFFGAKVRGRRTGIIFNDVMDDFSTPGTRNGYGVPASPSNYIAPGKIPMSSMSPTIIKDRNDKVVFLSGAAGGTRITTATSLTAINSLWFGQDLLSASDGARIHHQLLPNHIVYENWLDEGVRNGLSAKNHSMTTSSGIAVVGSIANMCQTSELCIEALSDGRKGGVPDGY